MIVVSAAAVGAATAAGDQGSTSPTVASVRVEVSPPSETVSTTTTTSVPTTSTNEPTSASDGGMDALAVLATIRVELEHRGGYNRDLFAVWSDLDGDGCDTRAEVLIDESLTPAQVDPSGCGVVAGHWLSTYDGLSLTSPGDLDIDHVVALKEAWDSGAWQWSAERRIAYANDLSDPRTLAAVSAASNRQKGDKDPSNWLPQDPDVCRFLADWVAVKARWGLSMDESEHGRIRNLLNGPCAGLTITRWTPTP